MKVSKKDILLLIGFIGILAAVCAFFFVYQPTVEKTAALEQENTKLQSQINDLTNKMANKDTYESETARMNQEMEKIYQLFPVNVKEENAILLAINQEMISPMDISSISITLLEEVNFLEDIEEEPVDHTYEIDQVEELEAQEGISDPVTADTPQDTQTGATGVSPIGLYDRQMTMNYVVSYEGLKRSIKNLCMQTDRTGISSVSVAFDETTGLLSGTTTVDMYCVPNQEGKIYTQPDFSSVLLGTDNPFGTMRIVSEGALGDLDGIAGAAGAADAEAADGAQGAAETGTTDEPQGTTQTGTANGAQGAAQ